MELEAILQKRLLTCFLKCIEGTVNMLIRGMSKVGLQGRQFSFKGLPSTTRKKCCLSCLKQCTKMSTQSARNPTSSTKMEKLKLMLFWLQSSGTDSKKETSPFSLIFFTDNWNQKCSVLSANPFQSRLTHSTCWVCRFPNNLYSQVLTSTITSFPLPSLCLK